MKDLRYRLQSAARTLRVNQTVIERDYIQSYVLLGISNESTLSEYLVFKGGTALKKVYFNDYRFSEDLDFSVSNGPKGDDLENLIQVSVDYAEAAVREHSPVALSVERYQERVAHPGGQEAFVIRVQLPWQRQPMFRVKIEVTSDEPILLSNDRKAIFHSQAYEELVEARVRTYSLEEIAVEKLRATQQTLAKMRTRGWARPRARDYYDLWHLVCDPRVFLDWIAISRILPHKCDTRGVQLLSIEQVFEPQLIGEVRATWARTLGPFIPQLPEVEIVLRELHEGLLCLFKP